MTKAPISVEVEFKAVTDHYKQDLREFFTRSNFYLAVQAALLSVSGFRDLPVNIFDLIVTLVLVFAGLMLSVIWGLVTRGNVQWIGRWRNEVRCLSKKYSKSMSYDKIEAWENEHPWMSAEKVTKYLPWLFFLIWIIFGAVVVSNY